MAAQKGRLFLLGISTGGGNFTDIVEARSTDLTINSETVDVTNKGSAGFRELLADAGIRSMSISLEGTYEDGVSENVIAAHALAGTFETYRVTSQNNDRYSGTFQVSSYARSGVFNGEEVFSMTLESAGVVAFDQLDETIALQDETNYDGAGSNGSFVGGDGAGGTAYVVADTITLSDGTVITVDAIDANDDVTQFTVTSKSTTPFFFPETTVLTQSSTSGTGTAFVLTVGSANVATV